MVEGKESSNVKSKKKSKSLSLIGRLNKKLMIERGRNYFGNWFSSDEIQSFIDNPGKKILFSNF